VWSRPSGKDSTSVPTKKLDSTWTSWGVPCTILVFGWAYVATDAPIGGGVETSLNSLFGSRLAGRLVMHGPEDANRNVGDPMVGHAVDRSLVYGAPGGELQDNQWLKRNTIWVEDRRDNVFGGGEDPVVRDEESRSDKMKVLG
jgi:hypothetical protein